MVAAVMVALGEEMAADLSEAELGSLDALIAEPEPAEVPEPATPPREVASEPDAGQQSVQRQVAREFLSATDNALWHIAERSVTIEESASFDALVAAREQALAR